jgi:hypothetical protein
MPIDTLKKVAEREAAAADQGAADKAPTAKKAPAKKAAAKVEPKVDTTVVVDGTKVAEVAHVDLTPASFQWPKPVAKILIDYLTERVSAEVDVKNPGRPFISADGKLHVKLDDWREWLVGQGLAPSRNEASAPLREIGPGRTVKLPGVDKGVGFYVGAAPTGTTKLPRRPQVTPTRQPRNPLAGLSDEQRAVVKAALESYTAGTSVKAIKANGVRDELITLVS